LLRSKWAAGKAVRAGLALEGAYLNRYVTDEQRSRRPIFIATLWAGASWLFFRVARSTLHRQTTKASGSAGVGRSSDRVQRENVVPRPILSVDTHRETRGHRTNSAYKALYYKRVL
jgi:hypothetical protein